MSAQAKSAVLRVWRAFDAHDPEALAASLTPGWREVNGDGRSWSVAEAQAAVGGYADVYSGTSTRIDAIIAEGDLVAVRSTTTTTHRATGKRLTRYEIAVHRVDGDRVAQTWSQGGSPSFDEQLATG